MQLLVVAIVAAGLIVVAELGGGTDLARAQDSFFTSSPGPLAREHAQWDHEGGCNDCHVNNTRKVSDSKCLGCHDHSNLKSRINSNKGYHATSSVKSKSCFRCHTDHKGRSFNIMGWRTVKGGEKGFNHDLAGWKLRDKHRVLACKDCHKSRNKAGRRVYLGENKLCGSCHRNDQPHHFKSRHNMKCERCHSEVSWKPQKRQMRFDHNSKKDAEFPQEGAHKDVNCGKCHPKSRFNLQFKKPGDCRNCHKSTHQGHLFDKKTCSWCHSPTHRGFANAKFNHAARTRFKQKGKHAKLGCYKCHTKARGTKKPSRACETCHKQDNPHRDRFKAFGNPPKCGTCHAEAMKFSPNNFSHGKRTGFVLTGKHARVKCRACHRGEKPYQWEDFRKTVPDGKRCMNCHRHKNVHNGEYTDLPKNKAPIKDGKRVETCLDCHKGAGIMDIDIKSRAYQDIHGKKGRWPLSNGHKRVEEQCDKCHIDNDMKDTPTECAVRCHEDSLHEGRLGDECTTCHEPGKWEAVRFDHTDDTEWPLVGLHKTVPGCEDCHPGRKYADTPGNCAAVGCHAKDDAHKKKLGDKCENCHLETGENIFDHNAQSDYKLDGAHLTVKCADCHPSITFKPRPKTCFGGGVCHAEPDVHRGQFGTVCETCHNTISFEKIKPLHDVGNFSLRGSHDRLPCKRCHIDNRALAGTGNLCINCHRMDDVHSNSLSPRCGECHTQWSFAPARFDHSTVGCNLTGQHRSMPCFDCHKSGNFYGLSGACYSCHVDTVRKFPLSPDHDGVPQCSGCHNSNYWSPSNRSGGTAHGRESICF